ncbi:hypothetical protein EN812_18295 [Mesorhizobium sp. M4B.F.Ca.ET.169.01.1.1]|uniref:hypothetical protein n=1 Tax=unclassified Mesorhizobium TaxID=325217 RepID=UPI000FCB3543|nr:MULTISPECIES: hypothetical protein [unclassified Mesorhizobium]RVD46262.1 hypothetical protein EN741_01975 [Mesorhizobium sp. M4B.F.Ca.ET.019.03.1.1]TGT41948.1 hypothetical protein EN812_18295 [Mesorhizobium sp. M4B.F.Ca.ET.169.01.1.1]
MTRVRLTSLLHVEERLLEADYFARRIARHHAGEEVRYELNAFLSAARSVTFLLQKEMSKVAGFSGWWERQRLALAADPAAVFFLRLRNFSQKEGRISIVGTSGPFGSRGRWTYRFAGNEDRVPPGLLERDIAECCREHVAKLARMVLACMEQFPFHTCPTRAVSREGVEILGLSLGDVEGALGLPRGWTEVGNPDDIEMDRRYALLRCQVDGVDVHAIRKLSRWRPRQNIAGATNSRDLSQNLATALVQQLENR